MTNSLTIEGDGITAPLRHLTFRRIWLASVLANLGALIRSVGAAWAMTQMTSAADKVALVQTALMWPVTLISIPAGAIAESAYRGASLGRYRARRRNRASSSRLARLDDAELVAGLVLRSRQRHGADGPGVAIVCQ